MHNAIELFDQKFSGYFLTKKLCSFESEKTRGFPSVSFIIPLGNIKKMYHFHNDETSKWHNFFVRKNPENFWASKSILMNQYFRSVRFSERSEHSNPLKNWILRSWHYIHPIHCGSKKLLPCIRESSSLLTERKSGDMKNGTDWLHSW